jgi:hypothetical protein
LGKIDLILAERTERSAAGAGGVAGVAVGLAGVTGPGVGADGEGSLGATGIGSIKISFAIAVGEITVGEMMSKSTPNTRMTAFGTKV